MADDEYLNVDEVAAKLKLHARTIRRLLTDGKLPGVRFGGRQWRIPADSLRKYIDSEVAQRKPPTSESSPEGHPRSGTSGD